MPAPHPPFGTYALKGMTLQWAKIAQRMPSTWLGKRLAYALRKLVLSKKQNFLDGTVLGLQLRLHPSDNITDREVYFLTKSFDRQEREFMHSVLQEDSVFVDVGANSGVFSALALQSLSAKGMLLALEPNPVMFDRLVTNLSLNAPTAQLHVYPVGASEAPGTFTLHVKGSNLGGGSLMDRPAEFGDVSVQCRPLWEVVQEANLPRIDFLKIDVEGYEPFALNPFFSQAPKSHWPRYINIESPEGIDFQSLGYVVVLKTDQNTILELKG